MTTNTQLDLITQLQDKQRSSKITLGVTMGIILLLYFFTFAMLVDKFPPVFFIIEGITSLMMFIAFFQLNRISFVMLKRKVRKNPAMAELVARMHRDDVDKKPEEVCSALQAHHR